VIEVHGEVRLQGLAKSGKTEEDDSLQKSDYIVSNDLLLV